MLVENVGYVAGGLNLLAVDVEQRIDISALAFDADPVVEARTRGIIDAHVPLADEGCFVASVVEQPGPGDEGVALRTAIDVVDDAVSVGVLACEEAGAAG